MPITSSDIHRIASLSIFIEEVESYIENSKANTARHKYSSTINLQHFNEALGMLNVETKIIDLIKELDLNAWTPYHAMFPFLLQVQEVLPTQFKFDSKFIEQVDLGVNRWCDRAALMHSVDALTI